MKSLYILSRKNLILLGDFRCACIFSPDFWNFKNNSAESALLPRLALVRPPPPRLLPLFPPPSSLLCHR